MLPVLTDGSNRTAQQDVVLGGHRIPKGTMVWLFFNGLFNSTATWGNPDAYCPVRALALAPVAVPHCSSASVTCLLKHWQPCTLCLLHCVLCACAGPGPASSSPAAAGRLMVADIAGALGGQGRRVRAHQRQAGCPQHHHHRECSQQPQHQRHGARTTGSCPPSQPCSVPAAAC